MSENNCLLLVNKCRICLKSRENLEMHSFFGILPNQLSLAAIFTNVTSYQIEENKNLPKKICTPCKRTIIHFKEWLAVFQETEITLKSQIHYSQDRGEDKKSNKFSTTEETNDFYDDYFDTDIRWENDIKICEDEKTFTSPLDKNTKNNYIKNRNDETQGDKAIAQQQSLLIEQRKNRDIITNSGYLNLDYKYIDSFKYTCQCGDCFLYLSGFRQHMQFKHNTLLEENDFKKYSETIQLRIPIGFPNNVEFVSSNITAKKLKCRICSSVFLTKEEVKNHEEIHKTFICDHCGAAFLKKNYLTDHLRIHSEERRYMCKICNKTFKHRYTFSVHKKSHDLTRSFVCETCGASFKTRGTLRTHIRIKHSDIRNYPCPNCKLRFNLKSTLDKHFIRKHTSDRVKSFVCKCGAAYLNKNTLTRHIAEKHLGKAKYYPCTICNKVYVMKRGLEAHMLKKHGITCK